MSITFSVDEELTDAELHRAMVEKKANLDKLVLNAERMRGVLPQEVYADLRDCLKQSSKKVLEVYDSTIADQASKPK